MEEKTREQTEGTERDEARSEEKPEILEEVRIEEISVDGICGVY